MGESSRKSKAPAWAEALDAHVRDSKTTTWAKIAAALDMTEGGIRHWRNGTREIKLSEFMALCKAAGADPAMTLKGSGAAWSVGEVARTAREEMMLLLFRQLTPEQQRELFIETNAAVEGNREIQARFLNTPLRTYSNEEVESAFGKVPPPHRRHKRKRARPGLSEEDPE